MVIGGRFRTRVELRKKRRRPFHYTARIVSDADATPRLCIIADISESGARLVLDRDKELPERLILLLTEKEGARRSCRVIWRTGTTVGVEFVSDPA